MNAVDKAKARIDKANSKNSAKPEAKKVAVESTPALEAAKEVIYQVYKSSRPNQRIAMETGKLITIVASKFITCQEDEIEFLDKCVASKFPGLTKADEVTASDLDPMNALRKKFFAEFAAAQAKEHKVPEALVGDTETSKLNPASSVDIESLSAGSTSSAS